MEKRDLQEVWQRIADNTYTNEDLAFILDSDEVQFQQFSEVWERVRLDTIANTPPLTQEQAEAYRKKVAQIMTEATNKRDIQIQSSSRPKGRFRILFYAAAAAVLLCLLIPAAYYYMQPEKEQFAIQYIEEITQRGEIRTLLLPDATKVTLNADSRLLFPEKFSAEERLVELQGEALFEVTSDPERPFIVKNENMNIYVVGTVFDVKVYTDDSWAIVSVVSGKVNVDFSEGKALLEQNQQVKIDKTTGNFEKRTIDAEKYLLWIDGTLFFHRTPLHEVVNMLNRYYPQTKIELAEGEYTNLISGEHDNKRVEAVLTSIVYSTGLKISKKGNKYTIYHNKSINNPP